MMKHVEAIRGDMWFMACKGTHCIMDAGHLPLAFWCAPSLTTLARAAYRGTEILLSVMLNECYCVNLNTIIFEVLL